MEKMPDPCIASCETATRTAPCAPTWKPHCRLTRRWSTKSRGSCLKPIFHRAISPVCQSVGLGLLPATPGSPTQRLQTRRRASDFREAVLLAYNYASAM